MSTRAKNLTSCIVLLIFAALAISSSHINKLHYGSFVYNNRIEDMSEGNYLVKMDGTRIYGKKISWKSGLLVKNQVRIDDERFKMADIRGHMQDGTYYTRWGNDFIQRIVHGRINVYVQFTDVSQTSTDHSGFTHTHSYVRTDHYAQRGEDGPLEVFGNQEGMKKLLSECPLAVQMVDISGSKMRKAIRKDRNYLNHAFEIYNNDCKPLNE